MRFAGSHQTQRERCRLALDLPIQIGGPTAPLCVDGSPAPPTGAVEPRTNSAATVSASIITIVIWSRMAAVRSALRATTRTGSSARSECFVDLFRLVVRAEQDLESLCAFTQRPGAIDEFVEIDPSGRSAHR